MTDLLARICADKRDHIRTRQQEMPLVELTGRLADAPPVRPFAARLAERAVRNEPALICEIKRASPSRGLIAADFDPAAIARAYAEGGAAGLSVLTDAPYFQGADEHLIAARAACDLPVLRKDFILDPYQVYESRAIGADCILLIMAALADDADARTLLALAGQLGMDALVEIHDSEELTRAVAIGARLIGINNRNLRTLAIDLATTETLAPLVPAGATVIGESGIEGPADIARLSRSGVRAFLIGDSLMRSADRIAAVRALIAAPVADGTP